MTLDVRKAVVLFFTFTSFNKMKSQVCTPDTHDDFQKETDLPP